MITNSSITRRSILQVLKDDFSYQTFYLVTGTGNPCAGHARDSDFWDFSINPEVTELDENLGADEPIGSEKIK